MRYLTLFLWLILLNIFLVITWYGFYISATKLINLDNYNEDFIFFISCILFPLYGIYRFFLAVLPVKPTDLEEYMREDNIVTKTSSYLCLLSYNILRFDEKWKQCGCLIWLYFILNANILDWFFKNTEGFGLFLSNFSMIFLVLSMFHLWKNQKNLFNWKSLIILMSSIISCIVDSVFWRATTYLAVMPLGADIALIKQALIGEVFFLTCLCLKALPVHTEFNILTGLPLKPEYMFGPRFVSGSTQVYHIMGTQFDQILMAGSKITNAGLFVSNQVAKQYFIKHFGSSLDMLFSDHMTTKTTELARYNLSAIWLNEAVFGKIYESKFNLKLTPVEAKRGFWGDFMVDHSPKAADMGASRGLVEIINDKEFIEVKTPNGVYTKANFQNYCNKYHNRIITLPESYKLGLCIDLSASPYAMFERMKNDFMMFKIKEMVIPVQYFHQEGFSGLAKIKDEMSGYEECKFYLDEKLEGAPGVKESLGILLEPIVSSEKTTVSLNAESLVAKIKEIK